MELEQNTPEAYIANLEGERKEAVNQLRQTILDNLPNGFVEVMEDGMIAYVVPHSLYPDGYHCNPEKPLPFINLAAQKNFIALYHMGVYAHEELLDWFVAEYPNHSKRKLDMGKSCIRFKNLDHIPYELLADLVQKISVEAWIDLYERKVKK